MIDVTPLDLRFAEHERRVNRVNHDGWKWIFPAPGHSFRARLAQALLARAGRLGLPIRPAGQAAALPANRALR